jgi:alpha-mannosidase
MAYEGIRIDSDNVIATAFKPAYDGRGYILRLYEAAGRDTQVKIELPLLGGRVVTALAKANSILTLRVPDSPSEPAEECDLCERPLSR